ncbi:hypothetical protein RUND412_007125 [Rhizina undulata]
MIPVKSLQLEHIPAPHTVHIALFKDVRNASFLRDQLLAGNAEFEYAFIDASTIISTVHALAATHQAVHSLLVANKLRTRNVHSETVFCLSPNNNITDAFRRFGITANTTSLLCIKVSHPASQISADAVNEHLGKNVEGTPLEFNDQTLAEIVEWAKVGKNYKLKIVEEKKADVVVDVVGKMVIRAVG